MTKAELKEKLSEITDDLSDIQGEVEDIPDTAISDIDELINGNNSQYFNPKKGLDAKIQKIIDDLNKLANEEIEDDEKEAK